MEVKKGFVREIATALSLVPKTIEIRHCEKKIWQSEVK